MDKDLQYADEDVTRSKFNSQVERFIKLEGDWRSRGVFMIRNSFPKLQFLFTAKKLQPPSVVFCVEIDFTNFDVEPLSVRFIEPFSGEYLTRQQIGINFWQLNLPPNFQPGMPIAPLDLLQGRPQDIPFMCIRGVREYHQHPAHTGDSWLLYRTSGVGSLGYILDQLYNYSIEQLQSYGVDLQVNIKYNQVPKISAM